MLEFFTMLRGFYQSILSLFGQTVITFGSVKTSLGGIIFACVVIGFVVSLYWKGAKS